jgi:hypothetical protein
MIDSCYGGIRRSGRRLVDRATRPRSRWAGVAALLAVLGLVASGCTKGSTAQAATPGTRAYDVSAANFIYSGMPATIPHGNIQINFTNKESVPMVHEMILLALPLGKTTQDVIDSAKVKGCTGGGPCESQYLHFGEIADVSNGATMSNVFNLPPGNYFFACWQNGTPQGAENGPAHASLGMVYQFSVN